MENGDFARFPLFGTHDGTAAAFYTCESLGLCHYVSKLGKVGVPIAIGALEDASRCRTNFRKTWRFIIGTPACTAQRSFEPCCSKRFISKSHPNI
jgi:hypothetical protein